MLENEPKKRPNLREIVHSLLSLKRMVRCSFFYSNDKKIQAEIDGVQQTLEEVRNIFFIRKKYYKNGLLRSIFKKSLNFYSLGITDERRTPLYLLTLQSYQ